MRVHVQTMPNLFFRKVIWIGVLQVMVLCINIPYTQTHTCII